MKASEQLERLSAQMAAGVTLIMDTEEARDVIDALPELIAVVKAAENMDGQQIHAALAALNRALGEERA